MRSLLRPAIGFACLAAAACTVAPTRTELTQVTSAPVIKGVNSDASEDAVVLLVMTDGGFGACSGTLLAPNLVLTARHCVSVTADKAFACDADGNLLGGGTQVGADHPPAKIAVYVGTQRPNFQAGTAVANARGTKIFHDGAKTLCNHDLALVLLDTSIEGALIAPLRMDTPPVDKEEFTAIGWGVTDLDPYPDIRQQRTGIKIRHVGRYPGDGITEPVPQNEFIVGESICSGDSGGPAMAASTNSILGVVSRGGNGTNDPNDPAAGCLGAGNFYTRVDGFRDIIEAAYAEAGQDPWYEGQPDPRLAKFGATCGTDADCRSNACLPSNGTCSQDCSTDACPSGYVCTTVDTRKLCAPAVSTSSGCSTSGSGGNWSGLALAVFGVFALKRRKRS